MKTYKAWSGKRFKKRALVVTNDPVRPRFVLTMTGQVTGEPLTPEELRQLREKQKAERDKQQTGSGEPSAP